MRRALRLACSSKNRLVLVVAPLALGVAAVAAFGYFQTNGSGNATAGSGSLSPPTITSATAGAGSVALSWSAVSPPTGNDTITYYVTRDGGNAGGTCATSVSPSTATSCTDTPLTPGTYHYTVTALWRSWSGVSSPAAVTVTSGVVDHFTLAATTTTPTAGQGDSLTITAKDALGNTVTGYSGDQTLSFSGAGTIGSYQPTVTSKTGTAVAFGTSETITFTSGVASVSGSSNGVMTLYKAESATITVGDGTHTGSLSVTVAPASAASFAVSAPSSATAGSAISATLTAKDAYGNTATGYTGSHTIDFSGPHASPGGTSPSYPASVGFTSGAGTAGVTLYDAETTTLTGSDHASPGITGTTGSISVGPGTAASLSLSAASTTPTAGTSDNLTVTAKDTWLNTATGYTGSKSLTFTGASVAPDGSTHPTVTNSSGTPVNFGTAETISFTSGVAGVSGSSNGVLKLYKAETASLVVSDGSISNGSGLSVTVGAGTAASLSLSAASTTPTAGTSDNLTVTAKDTWLNTATGYTGNKSLTFTGASIAPDGSTHPTVANSSGTPINFGTAETISFTGGVAGVSGSSNGVLKLYKVETASLVVSDGSISNGSGLSATVSAASAASLSLSAASTTPTAGTTDNLTITAKDTWLNTATGYTGDKSLTFGGAANAPSGTQPTVTSKTGAAVAFGSATTITFSSGVASVSGSSNGVMTLYKAESPSLTVSDGSISNGSGLSVTVSAGTATSLSLSAASTTPTAGSADNLTITAKDTWLNTATGYTGSKNLTFGGASSIGANNPTVTNSSGSAIAFGSTTAITFTSGVTSVSGSSNGVMALYKAQTASVTVGDGSISNGSGLSVTVSPAAVASITKTSGDAQSANVGAAFASLLTATVTDVYGNAESGVSVTFGAPSSSASATFAACAGGNPQTYQCVVTTNGTGVATSSTFTANATVGGYSISASASGGSNPSVNFSTTNLGLLHISSLATGSTSGSTTWTGPVTVTVKDSAGNPVSGVTVSGTWSPTSAAAGSCSSTTNASGQCTISPASGAFPSGQLTETWTASNLSLTNYTYASASNVESTITLSQSCAAGTVCETNLTSTSTMTDTTAGTSSTTVSLSGTNTPPSGSTVLIVIARDGSQSGDGVSSVTGSAISNPTAVTSMTSNLSSTSGAYTNLWIYQADGTGTTSSPAVTVNFSKGDNIATLVQVLVLSGENTTTPVAQSNNTNKCTSSCTTTATVTLPSSLSSGSKEIVLVGEAQNTSTSMSSTSWSTKLFWARVSGTTGANFGSFFGTTTPSGTVTLGTSGVWGALAVEIAKAT